MSFHGGRTLFGSLMMGAASGKNLSKIQGRVQPRVAGSQADADLRRTWTRAADLIDKTYWTTAMETRNKQAAARLAQYGQPTGSGWEHPEYYHKPKAVSSVTGSQASPCCRATTGC